MGRRNGDAGTADGGGEGRRIPWLRGIVVLGVLAVVVVGFVWGRGVWSEYDDAKARAQLHVDDGYVLRVGLIVSVDEPLEVATVFVAARVVIDAVCEGGVAFEVHEAEIDGVVRGSVDFTGHTLTIGSGAVIEGDLIVQTHSLVIEDGARVGGAVTGSYSEVSGLEELEAGD